MENIAFKILRRNDTLGFLNDLKKRAYDDMMTIKEELFDQIEELNTSLRELTDYELVDCRNALINRTNILMGLLDELEDS